MVTRREFLDTLAVGAAGLAIGTTAKSYGQIMGSNDRLNFAVIGLNGRAYAHLSALKANKANARIAYVCDVDSNILKKFAITEGVAFELRGEFFNITNNQNFDTPTSATNRNVTLSTGTNFNNVLIQNGGSRTMRVGGKIIF